VSSDPDYLTLMEQEPAIRAEMQASPLQSVNNIMLPRTAIDQPQHEENEGEGMVDGNGEASRASKKRATLEAFPANDDDQPPRKKLKSTREDKCMAPKPGHSCICSEPSPKERVSVAEMDWETNPEWMSIASYLRVNRIPSDSDRSVEGDSIGEYFETSILVPQTTPPLRPESSSPASPRSTARCNKCAGQETIVCRNCGKYLNTFGPI